MSKRGREEYGGGGEVVEFGKNEDIWLENVFPLLYKEKPSVSLWLGLSLVSWFWLEMVRKIKEIRFDIDYGKVLVEQIPILVGRFPSTERLEARVHFGPYLGMFQSLRSLTITTIDRAHLFNIGKLVNLTSLTLGKNVYVDGLDKLVNLTYLSAMHIGAVSIGYMNIKNLTNLKHLCLGKKDVRNWRILLEEIVPSKSPLEYLESNDTFLFKYMKYTGQGKCINKRCIYYACYEGGWLNGQSHGNGSLILGNVSTSTHVTYSGIWEDGVLKSGKAVDHKENFIYEGEFLDDTHFDEVYCIQPHGKGRKVVSNDGTYEGRWAYGYIIEGTLHRDGELVYSGLFPLNKGENVDDF